MFNSVADVFGPYLSQMMLLGVLNYPV